MKPRAILVLPGLLLVAACSASNPSANVSRVEAAAATAAPADVSLVEAAAQSVAISTGVRPDNGLVFHTTREKAATAVDANDVGWSADAPVTVILFRGHFIDHEARVPPGSHAIVKGDEISLVYNANGQATDFGVETKLTDTAILGAGTQVAVSRQ